MGAANMAYSTPLMRLQDPAQTKVILVTLAETTPVLEAAGLQDDLQRAGIHPWAWVVNNSIAAARPQSPFLRTRARNEVTQMDRVRELTDRLAIVPLLAEEPIGVARLSALTGGIPTSDPNLTVPSARRASRDQAKRSADVVTVVSRERDRES
jgi:arsenite-transporting ATPase